MKRSTKIALGLTAVVVVIIIMVAPHVQRWYQSRHYYDLPFDSQVWLANANNHEAENPRGQMAADVTNRVVKSGMTKERVISILGKPDTKTPEGALVYSLGSWGGCFLCRDTLAVRFNDRGRVTEARIEDD